MLGDYPGAPSATTGYAGDFEDVTGGFSTTGTLPAGAAKPVPNPSPKQNQTIMYIAAALFAAVIFWPYVKKMKL